MQVGWVFLVFCVERRVHWPSKFHSNYKFFHYSISNSPEKYNRGTKKDIAGNFPNLFYPFTFFSHRINFAYNFLLLSSSLLFEWSCTVQCCRYACVSYNEQQVSNIFTLHFSPYSRKMRVYLEILAVRVAKDSVTFWVTRLYNRGFIICGFTWGKSNRFN